MFFSCTLYNPTCKKKATNIRLHTGVFLFKDSIVNTEAGVTFWETRIGAERGKPEISATMNSLLSQVKGFLHLILFSAAKKQIKLQNKQEVFQRKKENTALTNPFCI